MALEGGFLYTYLSDNIYIINCAFQFATIMQDAVGAALWMNQVNYLEIKDCFFSQNNAKYGNDSNIYLQDSKILVQIQSLIIDNVIFLNLTQISVL